MIPLRNAARFLSKTARQPVYAFRVFMKRLRALAYYRFGSGRSSMPEAITLFLTHRCNLRCRMCGQWGEGGVTRTEGAEVLKQELSPSQIRALVDDSARFGTNITLFGGEPLLYPGCADLIAYIKSKGLHCLMITNGSLLEQYAHAIVDAGLDELNLSLDGGEKLHDEIRGMPGLFARIMAGIGRVNDFKAMKNVRAPLINLQCTITKYNYHDLEQLLDAAAAMKADSLTFHNLIFLNRDMLARQAPVDAQLASSSKDWEGFLFDPEIDPDVLYEKIQQVRAATRGLSVDFYPNFTRDELRAYYCRPDYRPPAGCRCQSPWVAGYVFPDGEVRPCLNFTYSFGNVKNGCFSGIWNSGRAVRFRRTLKAAGIFPICCRCTELYRY